MAVLVRRGMLSYASLGVRPHEVVARKRAAGEANMRSKDRIHAEHLTNRKQGADDEKPRGIKPPP